MPTSTPGTLTSNSGTSQFNSGGAYIWKINNPTGGTAGSSNGWDLLNFSSLAINSTQTSQFMIQISGSNVSFDQNPLGTDNIFVIANSTSPITGFSASSFLLDTSHLTPATGAGQFAISMVPFGVNGDSLELTFTPVPEPGSIGLLGLGALALLRRPRRKEKKAA